MLNIDDRFNVQISASDSARRSDDMPGKSTEARSKSSGFLLKHSNNAAKVDILLELEAVLKSRSLVEDKLLRCAVRILEEVADTLKLNCNS